MHHPFAVVFLIVLGAWFFTWLSQRTDRRRIRSAVEERGGEVQGIGLRWWGRGARTYKVKFYSREGQLVTALCEVSLLSGVHWREELARVEVPLGTRDANPGTDVEALNEASVCVACGAEIAAWKSRCPRCGWSYKD